MHRHLYSSSPDIPAFLHLSSHCFIHFDIPPFIPTLPHSPLHTLIPIHSHIPTFTPGRLGHVVPGTLAFATRARERHAHPRARLPLAKSRHSNLTSLIQIATTVIKEMHLLLRLNPASFIHTMTTRAKEKHFRRCRTPGIRFVQTSCIRQA